MTTENSMNILCEQIRNLDNSIRFVGVANRMGTLLATSYRDNLIPLMNESETKLYAIQAVFRAELREDFQRNIGNLVYSLGKYDKLIRATVPIYLDMNTRYYLLISFEIDTQASAVIENKILEYISKNVYNATTFHV